MDSKTIIKQLEKALACKDDKEMRTRVEIVVDILKEAPARTQPIQPIQPIQIEAPSLQPPYKITAETKSPQSAGAIVSNGEQINYTRPKGT